MLVGHVSSPTCQFRACFLSPVSIHTVPMSGLILLTGIVSIGGLNLRWPQQGAFHGNTVTDVKGIFEQMKNEEIL